MDYFKEPPYWAIGIQCQCCDREITEADEVYADCESATDTGDTRTVEHVGCHVSVGKREAKVWLEAARFALHHGLPDLADGFNVRAYKIESRLSQHNEWARG